MYRTFSTSGVEAARAEAARSIALQQEIWSSAAAASREVASATVVVLPAINAMFDIAATRVAATQMHPPTIVYSVLALISLVCGFLVGYEMGATAVPSRTHMFVLALILSFTFLRHPRLRVPEARPYPNRRFRPPARPGPRFNGVGPGGLGWTPCHVNAARPKRASGTTLPTMVGARFDVRATKEQTENQPGVRRGHA